MPTVFLEWRGEVVETLPDYLKPGLKAVFVGINPALSSVRSGHYYQGRLWKRLRDHRIIQNLQPGKEDETAFAEGFGFTDVVKKPSVSAAELDVEDYDYGRQVVLQKLQKASPKVVCLVFNRAADVLEEPLRVTGISTFRFPGPYASRPDVANGLEDLGKYWRSPRHSR